MRVQPLKSLRSRDLKPAKGGIREVILTPKVRRVRAPDRVALHRADRVVPRELCALVPDRGGGVSHLANDRWRRRYVQELR